MIGDPVPTAGLPERLIAAAESPRWAEIAERCLACANCTLVCPTCFCTSVTQVSDLDGVESTAERTWDSCFTLGSRMWPGELPAADEDRYRQWLTHKFGTWWDQFGMSGCVGCGRCITWCPVGIDVREELLAVAPPPVPMPAAAPAPVSRPPRRRPPGRRPGPCRSSMLPVVDALAPTYARAFVVERRRETLDVVTLRLEVDDPALRAGRPGQFVMAALPAFSAAPISVSRFRPDGLELTIRAAGRRDAGPVRPSPGRLARRPRATRPRLAGRCGPGRDVVIVTGGIGPRRSGRSSTRSSRIATRSELSG